MSTGEPPPSEPPDGLAACEAQLVASALGDHAILHVDVTGRFVGWSDAAVRLTGFGPDEGLALDLGRLLPGAAPALSAARQLGRGQVHGWCRRRDDSRFWSTVRIGAIRDGAGMPTGFALLIQSEPQLQGAERAVSDSERRFQLLVNGVVDYAIYMLDPDGIISNWNTGAERIKGYSARDVLGRHFSCFYTPEDRAAGLPARALAIAAREGRYESEGWRLRKDGSRFWASVVVDSVRDEAGAVSGFAKVTRDISERRIAQAALQQSERQFRLLVGSMTDAALVMLDPDGVVSSWNLGAERITGYRADEIIGRSFSLFYTATDRGAGLPAAGLARARDHGKLVVEGWRARKDGSLFWAHVVIEPIRDESGVLVGYAKITRDVTERREAQLALHKAHERLAHAQKMEALGQVTGGVAHDFNNLLTVVGGHAQILRRLAGDEPRGRRAADAIDTAVERGERLTRQLLTFARRQRLQPREIDLPQQIAVLCEMLTRAVGEQIRIEADVPNGLWPVEVDEGEFELALVNVAVNARDAMPGGGALRVSAANRHLAPGDDGQDLRGEYVCLVLEDEGTGMAPDILARAFEPFFTTKTVDRGSGLGLSQVYGFAQQSGGAVAIDSQIGQGTRIRLYLPRATAAARPIAGARIDPLQRAPGGCILLVEDNPEVAEATGALVELLGYQVRAVGDAAAALALLDAGAAFDLVFSDVVMAGSLDGIGLARQVRQRWPGLPVLLATGYSRAAESIRDEFPVLRKPLRLTELERTLGYLIADARNPAPADNVVRLDRRR